MHITVIHVFNQCFIIRENFRPHHHLTNQFGFIGNETTKTIMITQIDTQGFGDVYSGFFSTIPSKLSTSKNILTTIREQAIIAKLITYAINSTLMAPIRMPR